LAAFTDGYLIEQAIAALRAAPLQPIAIVVLNRPAEATLPALHSFLIGQPSHLVVVAHYVGTAAAVSRQIREATQRCIEVGARTIELREADDDALWAAIANFTAPVGDGSIYLRAAAPGGALTPVAALIEQTAMAHGWQPQQLGIAGPGLLFSRWPVAGVSPVAVAETLAEVRAGMDALGGYVVVEEAPAALRLDRWGPEPEGAAIMRTLRASWDPVGILNPGRYAM
jgi:FAD/FMN-containing dehydrogenase